MIYSSLAWSCWNNAWVMGWLESSAVRSAWIYSNGFVIDEPWSHLGSRRPGSWASTRNFMRRFCGCFWLDWCGRRRSGQQECLPVLDRRSLPESRRSSCQNWEVLGRIQQDSAALGCRVCRDKFLNCGWCAGVGFPLVSWSRLLFKLSQLYWIFFYFKEVILCFN